MLSFHAQLKIFLASEPCDLRMNFSGLWTAAQQKLGEGPKSGALFVFSNRRHNRIKILYFDGTGTCILTKRLEKGSFFCRKRCNCCSTARENRARKSSSRR
jgi:transposase